MTGAALAISLLALAANPTQVPTCTPFGGVWPVPPATLGDNPTADHLLDWNEWMADLGPRETGNYAHRRLIQEIETQLATVPDLTLQRWSQAFTRWDGDETQLALQVGNAPPYTPRGYVPYSAFTPPGGLTAEIVYGGRVKTKSTFQRILYRFLPFLEREPYKFKHAHRDKIVAIDVPLGKLGKFIVKQICDRKHPDGLFGNSWRPYSRAIFLDEQTPSLEEAHLAGVRGLVLMLGMSEANAKLQYLPFTRPLGPVPALHLDYTSGTELKTQLSGDGTLQATMKLTGCQESVKTPHLIYTLKGKLETDRGGDAWDPETDEKDVVIVLTHTDGTSALEENAVLAMISLAKHLATKPLSERRHTFVFAFVTGHFAHDVGSADDFVRHFPQLVARANSAVVIEHLGATETADDPGANADTATGQLEPALLFTTQGHDLGDRAWKVLSDPMITGQRMLRIPATKKLFKSLGRDFFGEGLFLNNAEIPTVGYLANPHYLAAADMTGHIARIDKTRMRQEFCAFRHLLEYLGKRTDWSDTLSDPGCA